MNLNKSLLQLMQRYSSNINLHAQELSPSIALSLPDHDQLLRMAKLACQRASQQTGKIRELKIKPDSSCVIRFLPSVDRNAAQSNTPWAVLHAQHWLTHLKPVTCPRLTPNIVADSHCPVCEAIEHLSRQCCQEIPQVVAGRARWRGCFSCCVVQSTNENSEVVLEDEPSLWPWQFWLSEKPRNTLKKSIFASNNKTNPLNVLDLKVGCNFLPSRKGANDAIELLQLEPSPIFPLDEFCDERVDKLMSRIAAPNIRVSTQMELQNFATCLEEEARKATFDTALPEGEGAEY